MGSSRRLSSQIPARARGGGGTWRRRSRRSAAAVMVLLVVCLNMSGMVMVRAATRERELAVRLAIGASRRRLMQYLLSEAVVLALVGGALGATVTFAVPAALTWWFGEPLDVLLHTGCADAWCRRRAVPRDERRIRSPAGAPVQPAE